MMAILLNNRRNKITMIIRTLEGEILADKNILIKNSVFFRDYFQFSDEDLISITLFDHKYVAAIVEYIQTRKISLIWTHDDMISLCEVADYFMETDLVKSMVNVLIPDFSVITFINQSNDFLKNKENRLNCEKKALLKYGSIAQNVGETYTSEPQNWQELIERVVACICKKARQDEEFNKKILSDLSKEISEDEERMEEDKRKLSSFAPTITDLHVRILESHKGVWSNLFLLIIRDNYHPEIFLNSLNYLISIVEKYSDKIPDFRIQEIYSNVNMFNILRNSNYTEKVKSWQDLLIFLNFSRSRYSSGIYMNAEEYSNHVEKYKEYVFCEHVSADKSYERKTCVEIVGKSKFIDWEGPHYCKIHTLIEKKFDRKWAFPISHYISEKSKCSFKILS